MSCGHTSEEDYEDDKVAETGPNGTYVRFDHKLGSGAFKTVFRALDTEKGIEVAWNQVLIDRFQLDKEKVLREIEFFKQIRHQHIIDFYNYWTDERNNQVVFITELMPSGTLTDYIKKSPEVKLKIIKSWCKQILLGLNYLHTREPPIIHRDIKCGNIFINGTTEGEVKIGDLGLATFCLKKDALSVIGTPEFMAPEYYNEVYTTSVDIWAFGMAVIEMVTLQCPYAECNNVGQIFKKVSGGIRPPQLDLILDTEVKEFIKLCLADEHERPTAAQLLQHPFFDKDGENDNNPAKIADPSSLLLPKPILPGVSSDSSNGVNRPNGSNTNSATTSPEKPSNDIPKKLPPAEETVKVHVVGRDGDCLDIKVEIGTSVEDSIIEFPYNLTTDDPKKIAADMVNTCDLSAASYQKLVSAFTNLVERNDRAKAMTELSELVSDDLEDLVHKPNPEDSDSIHSEPMMTTPSSATFPAASQNTVLSDPETNNLFDLDFLADDDTFSDEVMSNQDNTDLQDLLDGEDLCDDGSEPSFGTPISIDSSPKHFHEDHDEDTVGNSSSDFSEEDMEDEEILALKAKHLQDMRELEERHENELRLAEQDILRKKQLLMGNKAGVDQNIVKEYYDDQQKRRNDFRDINDAFALCI